MEPFRKDTSSDQESKQDEHQDINSLPTSGFVKSRVSYFTANDTVFKGPTTHEVRSAKPQEPDNSNISVSSRIQMFQPSNESKSALSLPQPKLRQYHTSTNGNMEHSFREDTFSNQPGVTRNKPPFKSPHQVSSGIPQLSSVITKPVLQERFSKQAIGLQSSNRSPPKTRTLKQQVSNQNGQQGIDSLSKYVDNTAKNSIEQSSVSSMFHSPTKLSTKLSKANTTMKVKPAMPEKPIHFNATNTREPYKSSSTSSSNELTSSTTTQRVLNTHPTVSQPVLSRANIEESLRKDISSNQPVAAKRKPRVKSPQQVSSAISQLHSTKPSSKHKFSKKATQMRNRSSFASQHRVSPESSITQAHTLSTEELLDLPSTPGKPNLRPIIIDGSNVTCSHGNNQKYSCRGIALCVRYFWLRGHRDITCFVPNFRKGPSGIPPIADQQVLFDLEGKGICKFTPSRKINGKHKICYDDRFVLQLAQANDGIIVSNDQYRDLKNESAQWKFMIENRLLMFVFVQDLFMPPDDPLGKGGPNLDIFLAFPNRAFDNFPQNRPVHNREKFSASQKPLEVKQPAQPLMRDNQHNRDVLAKELELLFPGMEEVIKKTLLLHPRIHDLQVLADLIFHD